MTTDLITDKELAHFRQLVRSNQEPDVDRIIARLREAERLLGNYRLSVDRTKAEAQTEDYFARVRQP